MAPPDGPPQLAFYCPRCSGPIAFAAGAGPEAVGTCGCGVSIDLGSIRRVERANAVEGRVRAIDALQWWHEPRREGQEVGRLLVVLAREDGAESAKALEGLRRALVRRGAPAEVGARAAALLREMAPPFAPPLAEKVGRLLDDIDAVASKAAPGGEGGPGALRARPVRPGGRHFLALRVS